MRTTTQYRGWTIEIHSSRHKHFVKGTTFSASASMVPKTAFDELHRAGADQPERAQWEKLSEASSDGHCTVDQAESEALSRAKIAIDTRDTAPDANRAPLGNEPV